MSDLSDVLNTLMTQAAALVYPAGTSQPSVTGGQIRVVVGWPVPGSLDLDLKNNVVNISIFPAGQESNTTRYPTTEQVMGITAPTLTLTQSGSTIAVGGTMPAPFGAQNLVALIRGQAFSYGIQPTDTLTSAATGLATLINAAFPGTTSAGPVITLPAGPIPSALRVGTVGTVAQELERLSQRIQITVWAPDPTTRATVSGALKQGLAQLPFLTMPDGFAARLRSAGGLLSDVLEKAKTYRRDLIYEVEYATTLTTTAATVEALVTQVTVNLNSTPTSRSY